MTVPRSLDVMADVIRKMPAFLTGPALNVSVIEFAAERDVLGMPGVLTPTEVITAWQSGADLVKVLPCAQVGGHRYIQALTRPFPHVPLVAAGGITQLTAAKYILAGATAVGVGAALIPRQAIKQHEREWIPELARRFVNLVQNAREQLL